MKRRAFIKGVGVSTGAAIAAAPNIAVAKEKFRWKLATTWAPKSPILQESSERFAKIVKEASNGRLRIKVFAGGELIPPLTVFDAVSEGTIQMGAGAAYYWAGKIPSAQLFGSVPFGMNAQHLNAWITSGGGQELWEEIYAPFNVVPMRLGNTGTQMGGWFKKEINSPADLKGLKMRMPGLAGKALAKAGANVVLMAGSEVYTALERGTIDATEWVSPFHDERIGLYRAAKNYYYPGWHEPGTNLELTISKPAWDSLPKDLQAIVKMAAKDTSSWVLERSEAENGPALERLVNQHGVKLKQFPKPVLKEVKRLTKEVLEELAAKDKQAKKVYESYTAFQKSLTRWSEVSEEAYGAALRL